jgi:uncharacterized membrane protein YccC
MWQRAAHLARPVTGDWMTTLFPDWLVEVVRPRRAPVPWGQMLRAVIAICVPMSVGIASGQRALGLLIAIGGLLGIVVDTGGAYLGRLRRVGFAALGGAIGITIGSLIHGRGWIAVLALMAVAAASALLSAISDVGSVAGLQMLVYSALGLGAIGALRPWWHTALGFLAGAAWAVMLTVPSWLLAPRAAEQDSVAAVYHALAQGLRTIGTPGFAEARRNATATINAAYDTLLTARAVTGGRSERLQRLMAVLNQGHLIAEAGLSLSMEGSRPPGPVIEAVDRFADAVGNGTDPPPFPQVPSTSPGMKQLRDGLAGLSWTLSGNWAPPAVPAARKPPLRQRLRRVAERLGGRLTRTFALRLTVCVGVAAVLSEVLPLQRSYWVVLTVAIVLKPDLGSVFVRAVQRGAGTVVGAVLGAVILVLVPYGPWLLIPFAILAALLPYGRSRNFGLMAVFLTPLVVLLIDLLAPGGWHLALDRLLDTLLGCAVALVVGYAPWPASWQAHLPGQFAETIRDVCRYAQEALVTSWQVPAAAVTAPGPDDGAAGPGGGQQPGGPDGARPDGARPDGARPDGARPDGARPDGARPGSLPKRSRLRRRAYRALSDLRTEFERTMSEPAAVSRRATAWYPALVGLEELMDAIAATAVAIGHGSPPPAPDAVRQVTAALEAVADAIAAGVAPPAAALPSDEALRPVTEAARSVLSVLASPGQAAGRDAAAARSG